MREDRKINEEENRRNLWYACFKRGKASVQSVYLVLSFSTVKKT